MKLSINLAEKLEVELYGTVRQMPNGEQIPAFKGILQKGIPVYAKIVLEQQVGKKIKDVLEPYREEIKKITDDVKAKYKEEIKELEKAKIDLDVSLADETLKDSHNKLNYNFKIKEYDLTSLVNSDIEKEVTSRIDKNKEQEIEIRPDWKIKYTDFNKTVNVDGNKETINTLDGDEHYAIFVSNFVEVEA